MDFLLRIYSLEMKKENNFLFFMSQTQSLDRYKSKRGERDEFNNDEL
jgi:hypothetical protein